MLVAQPDIVQVERESSFVVLTILPRRIYLEIADRFREDLLNELDAPVDVFIIDFSSVNIMNSSAIGVLLLARDQLKKKQKRLVVCGLRSLLLEVFNRMQLQEFFTVVDSVKEAKELAEEKKTCR
ncbi:MAG TPA: STAS domain-containing protein [bacterium]|nr:STAS domain-containing protein [bacterium]HPG46467.1 STAS domain-containing protein [bacterium]HPM98620.1 STAS domain-containing protein [bacterium]